MLQPSVKRFKRNFYLKGEWKAGGSVNIVAGLSPLRDIPRKANGPWPRAPPVTTLANQFKGKGGEMKLKSEAI